MPKRAAAKLDMKLSFTNMPTDDQLAFLLATARETGAEIKKAELKYTTPSTINIK